MPIEVEVPDFGIVEFPDEMDPEEIRKALSRQFAPSSASKPADSLPPPRTSFVDQLGPKSRGKMETQPTIVEQPVQPKNGRIAKIAESITDRPPSQAATDELARQLPKEEWDSALEAVSQAAARKKIYSSMGTGAKAGSGMIGAMGNIGAAVKRWTGGGLDDEQTKFSRRLLAVQNAADPIHNPDAPWWSPSEGVIGAAEMAPQLAIAGGAGKLLGATAKALGAGQKLVGLAAGAGSAATFAPEMYDATYDALLEKGINPRTAKWAAATSATLQSALFAGLPKALAPKFEGVGQELAENLVKQYAKTALVHGPSLMAATKAIDIAIQEVAEGKPPEVQRLLQQYREIGETYKKAIVPMGILAIPGALAHKVAAQNGIPSREDAKKLGFSKEESQNEETRRQAYEQRVQAEKEQADALENQKAGQDYGDGGARPRYGEENGYPSEGREGIQPSRPEEVRPQEEDVGQQPGRAADVTQVPPGSQPPAEATIPAASPGEARPAAPGTVPEGIGTTVEEVTARRALRGEEEVPPKPTGGLEDWKAQARRWVEEDPTRGPRLVKELNETPRDISAAEVQVLKIEAANKENALNAAEARLRDAKASGNAEQHALALKETMAALDEAHAVDSAARVKGTLWSESGRSQQKEKVEGKGDFSTSRRLIERTIAKEGEPPTEEEHIEITKLTTRIKELEAELQSGRSENPELDKAHTAVVEEVAARSRQTPEDNVRDFAQRNGLNYDQLLSAAEEVHQGMKEDVGSRRAAKLDAHRLTGLNAIDVARIENSGKDYASTKVGGKTGEKLRSFDEFAQELVSQHPDVFPGAQDSSRAVWDLLREPAIKDLRLDDPRVLREAAAMASGGFELSREPAESAVKGEKPAPKPSVKRAAAKKRVSDAWAGFRKTFDKGLLAEETGAVGEVNPERMAAAVELVRAHVDLGVTYFREFMKRAGKELGDTAEKLRPLFVAAWKQAKDAGDLPEREVDATDLQSVRKLAKQLHREVVELGTTGREEAVDAVHDELQQLVPGITRRQTQDAMSGYGDFKPLPKDAISVKVREHKSALQLVSKIEDVQKRIPLAKSGIEREKLTDEARRLTQQLNEEMRRLGIHSESELRSPLDAAKAAIRNRMKDRREEVLSGKPILKQRTPLAEDAELKELRDLDAVLSATHREKFSQGKAPMTDAQKARLAEQAIDRSIAALEKEIKADTYSLKTKAKKPTITSEALEAKRAKRDWLRDVRDQLRAHDPQYKADVEAKKVADYKVRLSQRLADYQDRVSRKDYSKKEIAKPKKDRGDLDKEYEIDQLKRQLVAGDQRAKDALRSPVMKIAAGAAEAGRLYRTYRTILDYSALLYQGSFTVVGHPILAAQAVPEMLAASFSPKYAGEAWRKARSEGKGVIPAAWEAAGSGKKVAFESWQEIRNRENFHLYIRDKLAFTEAGGPLTLQEDAFASKVAKYIPGFAGSERAFTTLLNRIRADLYDIHADKFQRNGGMTPAEGAAIANFANVWTGRGQWKAMDSALGAMAQIFFSPRLMLANAQATVGQPIVKGFMASPRAGRAMVKEYAKTLAGFGLVYTMAMAYKSMNNLDDDQMRITFNPLDSEFGKVRSGDHVVDFLGGKGQVVVFLGRMSTNFASGLMKLAGADVSAERLKEMAQNDRRVSQFFGYKVAPVFSLAGDIMRGKTFEREDLTPMTLLKRHGMPLSVGDIYETMVKEEGVPAKVAFSILVAAGLRSSYYPRDEHRPAPVLPRGGTRRRSLIP